MTRTRWRLLHRDDHGNLVFVSWALGIGRMTFTIHPDRFWGHP